MKSDFASAVLLILLTIFCLSAKARTTGMIDALYELAEGLPECTEAYAASNADCRERVEDIGSRWSEAVVYFSYVCAYPALNRADEAVWDLYAAVRAGDYPAAAAARYQLLDALRRMRELEGISLASVF